MKKFPVSWPRLLMVVVLQIALASSVSAAPFAKNFHFTQPNHEKITLWGQGDEFYAVFETTTGYTVIFDPQQKAYFYATRSADGKSLVSTGVFAHEPPPQGLEQHIRIDSDAAAATAHENHRKWDEVTGTSRRWHQLKSRNLGTPPPSDEPLRANAPPPTKTTGNVVGLTMLIDFPDEPATIPKAQIESFVNGPTYTGYENNGSVWKYFHDNSNSKLNYTNKVTAYIRMAHPKSYYNNTSIDNGTQGRLIIADALAILKARSDYRTVILPTFSTLTTDEWNNVVAFNVYYAGDNGGVWGFGLWPHSYALAEPVPLGNGKNIWRYQITNVGDALELGTFCHENGHMVCSFPDLYDYDYDSKGGAGAFSLMGAGGSGKNPSQIDAYLKTAAGWATVTDLDITSNVVGSLKAAPTLGYNHFYRYRRPGQPTEYFLLENRQQSGRDELIPASGIAIWHVDELGDRDNQNLIPNADHQNYELTLVQADDYWDFEYNMNDGDPWDLYYLGNFSFLYSNTFNDESYPSSRWWDGSPSYFDIRNFSAPGMTMTLSFTPGPSYYLKGTVFEGSSTGPVVAGAIVSIAGKSGTTSTNGTFTVNGVPAGAYTLSISKAGFVPRKIAYTISGNVDGATFVLARDVKPPTVTAFVIPATCSSLIVPVTTFSVSDNVAVKGYLVTESPTKPLATDTRWTTAKTLRHTCGSAGKKILYGWAKDAAGNVSASRYDTVTIDTIHPTVTAFATPAISKTLRVTITTFTAKDNLGVKGYLVTESSTQPRPTAVGWSAIKPTGYTFSTAGVKKLFAWVKDAAGNVSTSRSAAVTVDITVPTVTAFAIPAKWTALKVPITTFTATDNLGIKGYLLTESYTKPLPTNTRWSAIKPASYTFTAAGTRKLYAWVKDAAGNVSASRSASVIITLP